MNLHLAAQVASCLVHRLAPRSFDAAFPNLGLDPLATAGAEVGADEEDFHKMVRSKIWRAKLFVSSPSKNTLAACVVLAAEPIDHLSQRVQKDSEGGNFLFSLLHNHSCPFKEAQTSYCRMLTKPPAETSLNMLFYHYGMDPDSTESLAQAVMELALEMGSQIWFRCETFFDRYPFRLASLVDPRTTMKRAM